MPRHSRLGSFLLCAMAFVAHVRGQGSPETAINTSEDDAIAWYESLGALRQSFEGASSGGEAPVLDPATKDAGLRDHAERAAKLKEQDAIALRIGWVRWAALTRRHAKGDALRQQANDRLVSSLDDTDARVRIVAQKELFRTPLDGTTTRHAFRLVTRWLVEPATSTARIRQLREHLRSRMRATTTAATAGTAATDATQRIERGEKPALHPREDTPRRHANESAAIATLRNVASAQAQCQACGVIDVDGDGRGEFGFFGELSGAQPLRESPSRSTDAAPRRMAPPVLSGAFGRVFDRGSAQRSGYWFRIYLPSTAGVPIDEATMRDGAKVDPERAEISWCAFAWPVERGRSGTACFAVDAQGDVWRTEDRFGDFDGTWTLDILATSTAIAPQKGGFCPSGIHWKPCN
ncbi:MAG: hypothetical protein H6832_09535 [Planctomycetes bacterium]|nr:hypothetical protein [Planctomycetota bacterium]